MNPEDEAEEDGANVDLDFQRKGKCVVLKTSTRQVSVIFLNYASFGFPSLCSVASDAGVLFADDLLASSWFSRS